MALYQECVHYSPNRVFTGKSCPQDHLTVFLSSEDLKQGDYRSLGVEEFETQGMPGTQDLKSQAVRAGPVSCHPKVTLPCSFLGPITCSRLSSISLICALIISWLFSSLSLLLI